MTPARLPNTLAPIIRALDEGEALNVLGVTVRVTVSSEESGGSISVFITENAPRLGPPLHIHSREDETFFVIDGEYRVRVGEELMTLHAGQSAFLPRGIPHTYANAGETTAKLLVLVTPGGFENFFRDVDLLCRAGTASPETLAPVGTKHGLEFVGPPIFT